MSSNIWELIYTTTRVYMTFSFSSIFCLIHTMCLLLSRQECHMIPGIYKSPKGKPHQTWNLNTENYLKGGFPSDSSSWVWHAIFPTEKPLSRTVRAKKSMRIVSICWIKLMAPMRKPIWCWVFFNHSCLNGPQFREGVMSNSFLNWAGALWG